MIRWLTRIFRRPEAEAADDQWLPPGVAAALAAQAAAPAEPEAATGATPAAGGPPAEASTAGQARAADQNTWPATVDDDEDMDPDLMALLSEETHQDHGLRLLAASVSSVSIEDLVQEARRVARHL